MRLLIMFLLFTTLIFGAESLEDDFSDEFEDEFETVVKTDFDPLSPYNRAMTSFNDGLYTYALFPVARGYNYILPTPVRESISNFFDNLKYPIRLVNNLLQLKFENSLIESERFIINSSIGVLGLFDPAYSWYNLEEKSEDFGQTLGHYGVGGGFHIVLPFFGPSNLRDTASLVVDWQIDPFFYQEGRSYNLLTHSFWESIALSSFEYFNKYSSKEEEYEAMKKGAVDIYPLFKEIYEQHREKEISE